MVPWVYFDGPMDAGMTQAYDAYWQAHAPIRLNLPTMLIVGRGQVRGPRIGQVPQQPGQAQGHDG